MTFINIFILILIVMSLFLTYPFLLGITLNLPDDLYSFCINFWFVILHSIPVPYYFAFEYYLSYRRFIVVLEVCLESITWFITPSAIVSLLPLGTTFLYVICVSCFTLFFLALIPLMLLRYYYLFHLFEEHYSCLLL